MKAKSTLNIYSTNINSFSERFIVASLLLAIALESMGFSLVFPIFTSVILHNSLGLFLKFVPLAKKNVVYSLIISLYPLCCAIGAISFGFISNYHYSRIKLIAFSLFGNFIGCFLVIFGLSSKSFILLFFGRIVSGLTAGCITIVMTTLVEYYKSNSIRSVSMANFFNAAGFAAGPIIASSIMSISHSDIEKVSLPLVIMLILIVFTIILLLTSTQNSNALKSTHKHHAIDNNFTKKMNFNKNMLLPTLLLFLHMLGFFEFYQYIPVYLTKYYSYSSVEIGYFLSFFIVMFLVSCILLFFHKISEAKMKLLISISLFIEALLVLSFTTKTSLIYSWIAIGIAGLVYAFLNTLIVVGISKVTDKNAQGTAMGIATAITFLGWSIGPIISSVLGYVNLMLPVYSAAMILFFGVLVSLKNQTRFKILNDSLT